MDKDLIFTQLKVGNMDNFCYIFADKESKKALLIDPSFDKDKILNYLKEAGLKLEYIVLTHHHFDHVKETRSVKDSTGAKVYAHPMTSQLLNTNDLCDLDLNEGDEIKLGKLRARCIHTPGHTPGGICLIVNDHYLVTGDTLFVGDCGRVDLLESDPKLMGESLARIRELPDELIVCPGHDYGVSPTNKLGEEKKTNPTLNCENWI